LGSLKHHEESRRQDLRARLRNANSPCSPAQQTAFNNYVHGFVPSVLYPQQDMNAKTGELRMSSKEARWVDWTLGA
jgi:hypothetical protein